MARILVIDDDASIRELLAVTLGAAGHEVICAAGGDEGVEVLSSRLIDLVLLDLMMPERDGMSVLAEVREMPGRRTIPVIVLTARHEPDVFKREVELGVSDHVVKPFMPSELEVAVERALSDPDAARQRRRILATDAAMYSSLGDLMDSARESVV